MNYKTIGLALLLAAGSLHAQTPAARERVLVQAGGTPPGP
jgi:hypothetical protein